MKALYTVVLVTVVTAIAACASIPPAAVQVGDRCARCRRTIGDLRLVAETIDQLKTPRPYRTSGCLAKYIKGHQDEKFLAIYVTDHGTGRMVLADDAWFVPTTLTQPDGRKTEDDYLAFRSRKDADAYRGGTQPLLRWTQVVAEATTN
jgi:hypothetical protein